MYKTTTLLGILFLLAPSALGYSTNTAAYLTSILIGVGVTLSSLLEWANEGKDRWEYWIIGGAGILTVASPFLFNFAGTKNALQLSVSFGLVFIGLAGYKLFYKNQAFD